MEEEEELVMAGGCGVGHRLGSDPALLWLWRRLAAVALIRPWEPPYAANAALKSKKKKKMCVCVCINKQKTGHFFCLFLGLHPQHTEVPRLGVESEL